jgi:hypothetical protein
VAPPSRVLPPPVPPPLGRRRLIAVLAAAAPLAAGACATTAVVAPGLHPGAGATVRVLFPAPRDLAAASPAGDTLRLAALSGIGGQVGGGNGDTLILQMREAQREPGRAFSPRSLGDRRVVVMRRPGDRLEVRRVSPGRTLGAVVGFAAVAVAFVLVFAAATFGSGGL